MIHSLSLSAARCDLAAASHVSQNLAIFAGGFNNGYSDVVDIFNGQSFEWSTAVLSSARFGLVGLRVLVHSANSNNELVMFAGGASQSGGIRPIPFHFDFKQT